MFRFHNGFLMCTLASWMMTYLGGHPEWRHKVTEEVRALLSENSSETCHSTVSENLAAIPLEAWESNTPVLDKIIRETLRVAQPHTAMRRNVGPETYLNGTRIPSGAYVVYPFSDVHLNEELYPNPWAFDPDRPDPNLPFGYVGWGGGEFDCQLTLICSAEVSFMCHRKNGVLGSAASEATAENDHSVDGFRPRA